MNALSTASDRVWRPKVLIGPSVAPGKIPSSGTHARLSAHCGIASRLILCVLTMDAYKVLGSMDEMLTKSKRWCTG